MKTKEQLIESIINSDPNHWARDYGLGQEFYKHNSGLKIISNNPIQIFVDALNATTLSVYAEDKENYTKLGDFVSTLKAAFADKDQAERDKHEDDLAKELLETFHGTLKHTYAAIFSQHD